jgi:predicted metalloprotease
MRWQGRRESDNVEDRRDESGGRYAGAAFVYPAARAASYC